jgi:hypothetical protein
VLTRSALPHRPSGRLPARLPAAPSAEVVGLIRAGAGLVMLARPAVLPRLLGADSATAARVTWLTQMLGAREVALGAGSVLAQRRGGAGARTWLYAGVLADGIDAVAVSTAIARGRVSRLTGAGVVVTAAAAAAGQLLALRDAPGRD